EDNANWHPTTPAKQERDARRSEHPFLTEPYDATTLRRYDATTGLLEGRAAGLGRGTAGGVRHEVDRAVRGGREPALAGRSDADRERRRVVAGAALVGVAVVRHVSRGAGGAPQGYPRSE